jgi:hypothetical protein
MRYMQRVENRRTDLELVGTFYDPAPQTEAARTAFAEGRALYLSPGLALPVGSYRYALLGPLLEIREGPRMQQPEPAVSSTDVAVAPSLSLAGWDLSTALEPYPSQPRLAAGRTERVTLYWQAEGPLNDVLVRLRLTNPDGRLVAQTDEPPVRGLYPSSRWQRGEFVADVHNFLIPAGTPPGKYSLYIQVMDTTRSPVSREIKLASVDITRATNATRDQVFVQHSLDLDPDRRLAILGYGGTDGVHKRGYPLGLYLVWNVRTPIDEDLELHLTLADRSGQTLAGWRGAPIAFYPTHEWQAGELLKAYYDLDVPDMPAGTVTLQAGLNYQTPVPIAEIQIVP